MSSTSKNGYPRAMPLHNPEDLSVQTAKFNQLQEELSAQMRRLAQREKDLAEQSARMRSAWRLAAVTLLGVVLAAGTIAFALSRGGRGNPPLPESAPIAAPVMPIPDAAIPVAAKVAPLVVPAAQVKPEMGAKVEVLETLGALSATHLYQSHLSIGLLADGVESEIYTIAQAEESLKPMLDMMQTIDARLAKLAKSDLDEEDRRSIEQIQAVSGLLRLQAESLRSYWKMGNAEQAQEFEAARKASANGLSKVLGL
jgi:hypothetical protein